MRWRVPIDGARLTHQQFLHIVYGFAHDDPAIFTAEQCGVSKRTVYSIYRVLLVLLLEIDFSELPEVDERELEAYHQRRNQRSSGWKKEDRANHLAESSIRLAIGQDGRFWLFGVMLQATYERRIKRSELR